jgi:hypothetical protein
VGVSKEMDVDADPDDDEYRDSGEEDDEGTLEAEERAALTAGVDANADTEALVDEATMPLEELLARYQGYTLGGGGDVDSNEEEEEEADASGDDDSEANGDKDENKQVVVRLSSYSSHFCFASIQTI